MPKLKIRASAGTKKAGRDSNTRLPQGSHASSEDERSTRVACARIANALLSRAIWKCPSSGRTCTSDCTRLFRTTGPSAGPRIPTTAKRGLPRLLGSRTPGLPPRKCEPHACRRVISSARLCPIAFAWRDPSYRWVLPIDAAALAASPPNRLSPERALGSAGTVVSTTLEKRWINKERISCWHGESLVFRPLFAE